MRCEQITEYLSAYIEGELEPGLKLNVDQHMEECVHCREDLSAVKSVFSALGQPGLEREPPEVLHDNVMRRLRLEQREKRRTPAGWFASLSRGWQGAAIGASAMAVVAFVFVVGPLHNGSTAGLKLPWVKSASSVAAPPSLTLVGSVGGFRQSGAPDELLMDVSAPRDGHWKMSMDTSAGITLPARATSDPAGGYVVWEGDLAAGDRQRIPVTIIASTPNVVNEIRVRFSGTDGAAAIATSVLLPVQTHAIPGVPLTWRTSTATTVSQALSYLAGSSGVPIAAPTDSLEQPVTINMANVPADVSIEAVAAAASLKIERSASAYNLHK